MWECLSDGEPLYYLVRLQKQVLLGKHLPGTEKLKNLAKTKKVWAAQRPYLEWKTHRFRIVCGR